MGWLYSSSWKTRQDIAELILRNFNYKNETQEVKVLKSAHGAECFYVLAEETSLVEGNALPKGEKERFIIVVEIDINDDESGYKGHDWGCGPILGYDCPLEFLDEAGTPPNDWATRWTERVREYHVKLTGLREVCSLLIKNDRVKLNATFGNDVFTVETVESNDSFIGTSEHNGARYRVQANMIEEVVDWTIDALRARRKELDNVFSFRSNAKLAEVKGQKLLTEADLEMIPALYETENQNSDEKQAWVRLLSISGWEYYVNEAEKISPEDSGTGESDIRCFGYVKGFESEYGYFHLSEFISLNEQRSNADEQPAFVRDYDFLPCAMSSIVKNR